MRAILSTLAVASFVSIGLAQPTHPAPAGDGWQWDDQGKNWWRFAPQPALPPLAVPDALAEVNAKRAARGLRPFVHDPALTEAAAKCAAFRADRFISGHVMGGSGDFGFLPPGSRASAAGCAAVAPSWGFLSCCMWEPWTYAGAAKVMGRDGKFYCHLFVR
jgi:hypothetical protein